MPDQRSFSEKISGWFGSMTRSRNEPVERSGAPASSQMPSAKEGEVRPPWVEFPGIPPHEFFWREAGEPWLKNVWEPYLHSLDPEETQEYIARWHIPADWHDQYFNKELQAFWDSVDEP